MPLPAFTRRTLLAGGAVALTSPLHLRAQAGYPNRPVRLVVPFPPAGAADFLGRTVGERLAQSLGQQVLIVTSDVRVAAFDSVPTLREAGVDLVSVGWFGLLAPAGVPAAHRAILERQALAAVNDPAVAARITDSGSIPNPLGAQAFAAFIDGETRRLGEVVRKAGIEAS